MCDHLLKGFDTLLLGFIGAGNPHGAHDGGTKPLDNLFEMPVEIVAGHLLTDDFLEQFQMQVLHTTPPVSIG